MRLLLLTLAALLLSAAPAAAAPTWLPPGFLTDEGAVAPVTDIAVAPDGTAVAVWTRDSGGGSPTVEVARRAPGGVFAVVCTPTGGGQTGHAPTVAMDAAGNATIAWEERPAERIQATRLPAGATGCAAPQNVSTGIAGAARPALGVGAGGHAVVAFDAPGGPRTQYAAIRNAPDGAFAGATGISGPFLSFAVGGFGDEATTDVAVDPAGNAVVAYAGEYAAGRFQVEAAFRSAGAAFGGTSTAPTPASPSGTQTRPSVAIDGQGRATLAFSYDPDTAGAAQPFIQFSDRPAGGPFSPGQPASLPGEAGQTPELAATADGSVIGVWAAGVNDNQRIQTAIRQPGGGFGQYAYLSPPGNQPIAPSIAVNARGDAMVMWAPSNPVAVYGVYRPAGGAFGGVQPVVERGSPPSGQSFDFFLPKAGLDDEGNATAIWHHNHFRNPTDFRRVQSAAFDAAPPRLTASVPPSGVASLPVGMAATAIDRLTASTLSWSFGDGATATGGAVSHAFGSAGAFTVTVTATDAVGNATSITAPVLVAAPPPPPRITSSISLKWGRQGAFTYLVAMRVVGTPAGAKVQLRCRGKRCPFARKTFAKRRQGTIRVFKELRPAKVVRIKQRRFRAGQTVQVRITAPGHIGKVVSYRIKRRDTPTSVTQCLPVGKTKPQKRC